MCDLFGFLFPSFCVGCGALGSYVCPPCKQRLKRKKDPMCLYCGKRSVLGFTHIVCKKKGGVDGWTSLYKYDTLLKKIIAAAKYKRGYLVLEGLLRQDDPSQYENILRWKGLFSPVIIPIPLNSHRLDERGFNQAAIIAKHISSRMGMHYKDLLVRDKDTPHLAQINDPRKRRATISHAFRYIGGGVPQSVLLIDDVLTTGATMDEAARALKEVGVKNVLAFSLAK